MIGRTIAHYEITDLIGAGSMGPVYRATDTRLERDVAVRTLSRQLVADDQSVNELRRNTEALASLGHSGIGHIYGLEPADDSWVLVVELVEGPTLEDRLKRGPLPPTEALRIAQQIAVALESAHEGGIIHGDLKPSNVKVMPDGSTKILDFCLANFSSVDPDRTASTTEYTATGTPAYRSPEQWDARSLDRRTDIWSFGCVLYEMLTGRPPFEGNTRGALYAAVTESSFDLNLIADAPAPVRRLIERCLGKDPRDRLRDIGDARMEIEDCLAGRLESEVDGPLAPQRSRVGVTAALLLFGIGGIALGWMVAPASELEPRDVAHYSIPLPGQPNTLVLGCPTDLAPPLAISPDGRSLVFAAEGPDGLRKLWLRTDDSFDAEELPNTEGAELSFFSHDGKDIGYGFTGSGEMFRMALSGNRSARRIGVPFAIRGASWSPDNEIVYGSDEGLRITSASPDSKPRPLTQRTGKQHSHRWPQILPDGRVLYTVVYLDRPPETRIRSLVDGDDDGVTLDVSGSHTYYLAARDDEAPGFLLYMNGNELWAVRFDLATSEILGDPVSMVERIEVSPLGNPHFAVSPSGVLVYEPMRPPSPGRSLVWVNRQGEASPIDSGKGYEFPRLSPDGKEVLFAYHTDAGTHDIWTVKSTVPERALGAGGELRQQGRRVTNSGNFVQPVWSPDGEEIIFGWFGVGRLFTQDVGGSELRPFPERAGLQMPLEWRDSKLLFFELTADRRYDLLEMNLDGSSVRKLITTPDTERAGALSPDGKWLAYVSDETGTPQVYLCSYSPDRLGPEEIVSKDGGTEPVWSPTGRELFFRQGAGLWVVAIPEGEAELPLPKKLFDGNYVPGFLDRPNYDVDDEGENFVMVDGGWRLTAGHLEVHLNFRRELEERFSR